MKRPLISSTKRNKPWVLHSELEVPKHYTQSEIVRLWRGGRVKFFFDWGSGNVFLGRHPSDPARTFEEITGLRQLRSRSRAQQQEAV